MISDKSLQTHAACCGFAAVLRHGDVEVQRARGDNREKKDAVFFCTFQLCVALGKHTSQFQFFTLRASPPAHPKSRPPPPSSFFFALPPPLLAPLPHPRASYLPPLPPTSILLSVIHSCAGTACAKPVWTPRTGPLTSWICLTEARRPDMYILPQGYKRVAGYQRAVSVAQPIVTVMQDRQIRSSAALGIVLPKCA